MANWKGQSRGSVLGLKIYVFIIKTFGLYASYFVLLFVALYFVFFAFNATQSVYFLFRKHLGYSKIGAVFNIYKSYFTFGRIQLDRVAIASGLKHKYTFEFDGIQHIQNLLNQKRGGILLTAHIGNFNLAKHFFDKKHDHNIINLVVTDLEHEEIKNYLESVTGKSTIKLIVLQDDLSHIFKMNQALKNNELLVFAADRYTPKAKTYTEYFMGQAVQFPQGPFKLAARNNIPVLFVHIMREQNFHYHFYARPYNPEKNDAKNLLKAYIENLEIMVKKYPHQWYNYYDYWNDFS
ncbi:LpxL/LpxP family acyltransferase [Salegentibacter maritimus]|uniref:Lipid A biosynthesis acyltransferase n=1 Tax=Salegentibacter maritimus TaxID=2794347 RepID=A0ABS0TEW0_9FLAO|nr:lipid A biosynthesis acyltransferase [Salegentibacter maritimus]MBI6118796.1 lipid A biosynthesis acyltransferase [Salegentibacter maritimus]